jgi:hypothetical protein
MDMVLTNDPGIDEGQIMIFIKAGDSIYGFENSHSSLLRYIRMILQACTSKAMSTEMQKFREIFMPRACERYKYVKRNVGIDTLEFTVDDIRRPFNHDHPEKGRFIIVAWPDQCIENTLLPLLIDEGLIESISLRRYRLREDGKKYFILTVGFLLL